MLPVEAGLGTTFGDGLDTMLALDAQDQYNLTIIEPTFSIDPWYADNPLDANLQYETFMTNDLEPWVKANLSTTGTEQNWLIGFSKSGIGAQDLILKHPDLFQLAASWDFPADMSSYDEYGTSSADNYGTDANFQANYRLTQAFVDAHKTPFLTNNRIWIGGYNAFQTDISDYDALLTSEGILHTMGPSQLITHSGTAAGSRPPWRLCIRTAPNCIDRVPGQPLGCASPIRHGFDQGLGRSSKAVATADRPGPVRCGTSGVVGQRGNNEPGRNRQGPGHV